MTGEGTFAAPVAYCTKLKNLLLPNGSRERPTAMKRIVAAVALFVLVAPFSVADDRIRLTLDTAEADAVLAIAAQQEARKPVTDAQWQKVFSTEPYIRLKKREAELKRDFTDDDFKQFVLSDQTFRRSPSLRRTLEDWKKADLQAAAQRVLAYLPADAHIHAKVFPVIKPKTNSFVFEVLKDPTIFLYLDPQETQAKFANTVAHELHHIGYASVEPRVDKLVKTLPAKVRPAVEWMGAFGEGLAMLAAAGGPDVHPHAVSNPEERLRWDHDMANFNHDLKAVETFFLDLINGRLKTEDEQKQAGYSFFGEQGPWYTVGYKMAVMVEKRYGRAALIECMEDPRKLLGRYNLAAAAYNATHEDHLERWSQELLDAVGDRLEKEHAPAPHAEPSSRS
jgi:hypothetical protein